MTLRDRRCTLDTVVVLPDHRHMVMTLPAVVSDFSTVVGAM
ncbi:MAG: hypothetical protein AAF968_11995 [Pseudomonadota bacterium]